MTDPELRRASREEAESALDGVIEVVKSDMTGIPTEHRFELIMALLIRSQVRPAMLTAVFAVAVERLVIAEQLDHDLTPGP